MKTPIYKQIPFVEVDFNPIQTRVAFLDPAPIYGRLKIDPYRRVQNRATLQFSQMFLNENGLCACGCGKKLTGRKTRWATKECSDFAIQVWQIIRGYKDVIKKYIAILNGGHACFNCGDTSHYEVDHIIPVHKGGGGSWLNNYQLLCTDCHKKKTRIDCGQDAGKEKT